MPRGITDIETTYRNLLDYHNSINEIIACECGKLTSNKCYEKHLKSKLHFTLMSYKTRIEEQEKKQNRTINEDTSHSNTITNPQ